MALSDKPSRQAKKSTPNKNLYTGTIAWWSDRQKLEAVQTYLLLGNVAMTARVLKIPDDTMRRWYRTAWWKEITEQLKIEENLQLSARVKKIADKALDVVEERLDNGDWVYDQKTGELRRKGVSAKDAHKISMDIIDKRDRLNKQKTETSDEDSVDAKLSKLADTFAQMVNKKITSPTDVVDVDVKDISTPIEENTDALHEERETGLQNRE